MYWTGYRPGQDWNCIDWLNLDLEASGLVLAWIFGWLGLDFGLDAAWGCSIGWFKWFALHGWSGELIDFRTIPMHEQEFKDMASRNE